MTINAQHAEVQAMLRHRLGSLTIFNPSHPSHEYFLNMNLDEDRRLAKILITLSAVQSITTSSKTAPNFNEKRDKEVEDLGDGDGNVGEQNTNRWRVTSTCMVEKRVEIIVVKEEIKVVVISKNKKENKDQKKKKNKKNNIVAELPPTKIVTVIEPIVIINYELPDTGILRITTEMNVKDGIKDESSSSSSSSDSDEDEPTTDKLCNDSYAMKREKEIKKEEKRKVEAENRRIEEERRTSVALQRKKDRKRILDENDEEDSESVDGERKNILFKWKDVKWVNVANTGWMGIGRKEMVLKKVDLASPKGKGSFKKKKW